MPLCFLNCTVSQCGTQTPLFQIASKSSSTFSELLCKGLGVTVNCEGGWQLLPVKGFSKNPHLAESRAQQNGTEHILEKGAKQQDETKTTKDTISKHSSKTKRKKLSDNMCSSHTLGASAF